MNGSLQPRGRRARLTKPRNPTATAPIPPAAADGIAVDRAPALRPVPAPGTVGFGQVFTDHMFRAEHDRGWRHARIVPYGPLTLDPAAAVLHYGQAIFEGCKAVRGIDGKMRLFRVDRHIERMARSAARLCMPAPDPALMRDALAMLVRMDERFAPETGSALYLRPTLIASEAFLGVRPANQYLFYVIASPMAAYFGAASGPLRLKVETRYVRAAPGGLGAVKAGANYAASLRATEDARAAGFAQALFTDAFAHDNIEEAGTMNVFVHIGDDIFTPPLRGSILAGVTRDSVITLLERQGHTVRERAVTIEQIIEARRTGRLREMFGTGTGAGIAPIGELGHRGERIVVGDGGEGPLARHLMPALRELQTGLGPDPDGWMTEV